MRLVPVASLVFALLAVAGPAPCSAQCTGVNLLVSQGYPVSGFLTYYYGGGLWPEMTAAIDGAAASVTVAPNLEDLGFMLGFDALWIDQRDFDGGPGPGSLTTTEEANVASFIATGRRVVIVGENSGWLGWDSQILNLVGGIFMGGSPPATLTAVPGHELTTGVTQVMVGDAGQAVGGTPLFDANVFTVWNGTVVTLLDVNAPAEHWADLDNATFFTNVADWIGCASSQIFSDGFESGDLGRWSATSP